MTKPLTQQFREIAAIPGQLEQAKENIEQAKQDIATVMIVIGLLALVACALSIIALGRTRHAD